MVPVHPEVTFERLRYPFGGDRPSQTPRQAVSRSRKRHAVREPVLQGRYPNGGSGATGVALSLPPAYPVRAAPDPSAKLE